ncbi:MAG: flavin reductase family protein, partial [Pseudomonadota bacterium]|nr:flavin reductase family protein [Pseudomonadota bacterium]
MFYSTEKNDHGLPYNPYKSIVVPRPIGWISSLDTDGNVNLAPYSQFNNLGYDPPYVMFSASYKNSA